MAWNGSNKVGSSQNEVPNTAQKSYVSQKSQVNRGGDSKSFLANSRKRLLVGFVLILISAAVIWFLSHLKLKKTTVAFEPEAVHTKILLPTAKHSIVKTNHIGKLQVYPEDPNAFVDFKLPKLVKSVKLPNGTVMRTWEDGHKTIVVNPTTAEEHKKKLSLRRYTNPIDWVLASFCHPGMEGMPMPDKVSNEQVREWLSDPIPINEDKDDDEVLSEKEGVAELRQDLLKYMDEGGCAEDYFVAMQQRQSTEASLLRESRALVLETFRSGDYALTKELLGKYNEQLRAKGLPSVRLGKRFHEILNERTAHQDEIHQ